MIGTFHLTKEFDGKEHKGTKMIEFGLFSVKSLQELTQNPQSPLDLGDRSNWAVFWS